MTKKEGVDRRRGSTLWGINQFRSDALSQLLNDLLCRENVGFEDAQCDKVKQALGEIVNAATAIPDGNFLQRTVWKEMQDFADIYARWNSHSGNDPKFIKRRQTELKKLRSKRNKIARRMRNNQRILEKELDLKFVEGIYGSMDDLVRALPEVFTNLAKAVERFSQRKD
ncbi:hypothetical protein [Hahella chejuensis]|uniref:hypothetical protein n=1 Tax=Hahella chejuensis TaxID=158327 RepID=UPI0005A077A5|nr:hypothetical protein [Hahella chejuensis]